MTAFDAYEGIPDGATEVDPMDLDWVYRVRQVLEENRIDEPDAVVVADDRTFAFVWLPDDADREDEA